MPDLETELRALLERDIPHASAEAMKARLQARLRVGHLRAIAHKQRKRRWQEVFERVAVPTVAAIQLAYALIGLLHSSL
jgi:hypothetical protein